MNDDLPIAQVSGLRGIAIDDLSYDRPVERGQSLAWASVRRVTFGLILAVATFLNVFKLGRLGYGNTYYAAGVKSMLVNWHNFFFVSFDPGGFVSIDKPPLGFWMQAASAKIFGFHGWSLLVPEALAGVGSVALVYYLVRRTFGDLAGLLAAGAMAVMPVAVATNRSNIVDSLLVFVLLLGSWAVLHAAETGKLRWLLLAMVMVGLGFNIKMLEAYLVVPAFVAVYFLGARTRWRTRIWHLAVAGVVLLVLSLSWATAVDLTPASQRPYVGSSDNNTEYNLIFGYNGLNRLLTGNWSILGLHGSRFGGGRGASAPAPTGRNNATRTGFGQGENGASGPLRLVNDQLGGQAGWLIPLALIGILAAGWQLRPKFPLDDRHRAVLFWGIWLLTAATFFSVAGFFHAYYLVMLGAPIAALTGAGLAALWQGYLDADLRFVLLPVALIAVILVQRHILRFYPEWHPRFVSLVSILAICAAAGLIVVRILSYIASKIRWFDLGRPIFIAAAALFGLGVLSIGLAPTAWAMETTLHGTGGLLPTAGPSSRGGFGGGRAGAVFSASSTFDIPGLPGGANLSGFGGGVDPLTLEYLLKNQGSTRFLVATLNATSAAPIILAAGKPVMALGGFTGSDPILTVTELQKLTANGTVRFFLLQGGFGGAGRGLTFPTSDSSDGFDVNARQNPNADTPGGFGAPGQGDQFRRGSNSDAPFDRGQFGQPGFGNGPPQGEIRFPEAGEQPGTGTGNAPSGDQSRVSGQSLSTWVTQNCSPVSSSAINGTQSNVTRDSGLYDCRP